MKRLGWLAVGLTLTLGALGWASVALAESPEAEQVLRRAFAANESQTYTGTMILFTWAAGTGEATVIKVRHRAPGQSRLEYLSADREPYLVSVDDGIHHWQYYPLEQVAALEPSEGETLLGTEQSLDLLRRNYQLREGGTGEVAGRPADIVELLPHGLPHLSQRLWVERETGVILRTEQYRLDGSLAALSVFTSFTPVKSLSGDLFHFRVPKGVRVTSRPDLPAPLKDLSTRSGMAIRMPAELPPGYVYEGGAVRRTERENVVHLRFTDGLGVISLFEQRAQPFARYRLTGAKEVTLKRGKGWLHDECGSYVLNWTADGLNFTLVGEVPAEVLIRMAEAIPPGPSPGPLAYVRAAFAKLFGR